MSALSIVPYFPFARVKVAQQTVHLDLPKPGTFLRLEPDQRFRPLCHECGTAGSVHSHGLRRIIRNLDFGPARTFLQVEYRRVWCPHCQKAKVEQLRFADPSRRITHRLAQAIYDLCKVMTVQDVADPFELDPKTVKAVDQHFLQQGFGRTDYDGLSILAVDEIALRKGHQYMTVVLDYLTGRVVWMGEGRSMETLDVFFAGMSAEQKQGLQAVAMDMWEPFINRVQHHCPQAQIVFDLFHLVKAFGEVIDEVRREEVRKADTQEDRQYVKGSRYVLLKNRQNLRPAKRVRLRELLAANERISAGYMLKDPLKMIYHYRSRAWAKKALDPWCERAEEVDHPAMRRFIRRLRFFEYDILNPCDHAIGASPLEGVNNKIKVIKRRAYGFHDPEYFALKIKQASPGRKSITETG
ncbi:MAG: ISL3 family transposase [Planctomycetota bacterium]|nr:MAG: ISL3 family transposase [Planctomycetota bacterium]